MFNENEHMLSGHSMFTHWLFDSKKKKNAWLLQNAWGKDCMEKFCKDLKVHATKIINYEKKINDITNWSRK